MQVIVFIIVQICFAKSTVLKMFDGLYYYWLQSAISYANYKTELYIISQGTFPCERMNTVSDTNVNKKEP